MSNRFGRRLVAAACLMSALAPGLALADNKYPAQIVLSTSETIVGEPIHYPAAGPAKVTAAVVTIAPGEETLWHQHGVPMMVYILDGEVTVDYGAEGVRVFKAGDAFVEAMAVTHQGMNRTAAPVRILAVYMGAEGAANVVPKDAPGK